MLLLNICLKNKDNRIFILFYVIIQMLISKSESIEKIFHENGKIIKPCDEARSQCDRLYSQLSTVEEDCKTYRIHLGCLNMLKGTQSQCQADFHYWMMLSTTEKLIMEKCSPGDTSPIEPPREIFIYPVAPKSNRPEKIVTLSPCLDSLVTSSLTSSPYYSCAVFGHPSLINYSGQRETCRLQGAWPLVNNRYLSVQITGTKYRPLHFHDSTASAVSQVSVILKPNEKCLGDLTVHTLIYVASANRRLSTTFTNDKSVLQQSMIGIRSVEMSESYEKVELWFGYISTRIFISRTSVVSGEYGLSVSVLLPSQVATAKPRSKQNSLVRELCSQGCPAPESVDDLTLLSESSALLTEEDPSPVCLANGLSGVFFDSCYLLSKLMNLANRSSGTTKSVSNYISMSTRHVQDNLVEFSKLISENISIDLTPRTVFKPFRPVWKVRQLAKQTVSRKRCARMYCDILLTLLLSVVLLMLIVEL